MRPLKSRLLPLALVAGLAVPGSGCACTPRDLEDAGAVAGQVTLVVLLVMLEVAAQCGRCACH